MYPPVVLILHTVPTKCGEERNQASWGPITTLMMQDYCSQIKLGFCYNLLSLSPSVELFSFTSESVKKAGARGYRFSLQNQFLRK